MCSDYDDDFFRELPPLDVVDSLVRYYFDYCNWIYRHVSEKPFLDGWQRYKNGQSGDRIVLATACILMCIALRYLPVGHPLLERLGPGTAEDLSNRYHILMRNVLKRHRDGDVILLAWPSDAVPEFELHGFVVGV